MDIREITPTYYVAPQLDPADMQAVADAGITTVICNRPDPEVPQTHHAEVMKAAAEAAGLSFHVLPLTHQSFTPENISRHREIAEECSGKCLAYCASGTRSTFAWAMGQADRMPLQDIAQAAAQGGYDLSPIAPMLRALSDGNT